MPHSHYPTALNSYGPFSGAGGSGAPSAGAGGGGADAYESAVLADNPIFYYRMESGSLGVDTSGNGLTATATNVSETTSQAGGAGDFAGTTTSHLVTPADALFADMMADTVPFSLEWIMNIDDSGAHVTMIVAATGPIGAGVGYGGWQIFANQNGAKWDLYGWQFRGSSADAWKTTVALDPNTEYHCAMTVKCTRAAYGEAKVYIDGSAVAVTNNSSAANFHNSDAGHDLIIGAREVAPTGTGVYEIPFYGMLDEVAGYGKELSAAEVLAHYNAL